MATRAFTPELPQFGHDAEGERRLSIRATPHAVLTTVAVAAALLFALALVRVKAGVDIPFLTPVLAVGFLSLVPGFLFIGIFDLAPEDPVDHLLYCLGASLVLLMAIALVLNVGLYMAGVATPVSTLWMVGGVGLTIVALAAGYAARVDTPLEVSIAPDDHFNPTVLGCLLLPFVGAYGGLALTYPDTNLLLLGLYVVVAITPILVLFDLVEERYLPLLVWAVGAALLLQNTLTGNVLAWGDQPKEANLALQVLTQGVWFPALAEVHGNKYAMLRIVLLHPIYMLFTGQGLLGEFKLVHPILFSAAPVALFQAFRKQFETKVAYLSVFLYMSLFSFFIVLSRNTRTATAIFFLALLGMLAADRVTELRRRRALSILFVLGIGVCHYGTSYMVLIMLGAALLVKGVLTLVTGEYERGILSPTFVGVYITGLFGWYIYGSPRGRTFNLLPAFAQDFVSKLQSTFLSSSSSATTHYVTQQWQSSTLAFLTDLNLVIGLVMVLGLAITGLRALYQRELDFSHEYIALALTAMFVFSITFLPVERFNTARTYAVTLVFFAPFFAVGARELWNGVTRVVPTIRPSGRSLHLAITGVLLLYFLLNVGFISATVTNEYSPNALVEKDRIMEGSTSPPEAVYFFKQYVPTYDVQGNLWLRTHGEPNATVHESQWPGNMRGAIGHPAYRAKTDSFVPLDQTAMPEDHKPVNNSAYVYLASLTERGRTVTFPASHFGLQYARPASVDAIWANKSRIYTNGGVTIYR